MGYRLNTDDDAVAFAAGSVSGQCISGTGTGASGYSAIIDCSASCFSSESTLQLETGATVPVAAVRVGDRVLSVSTAGKPTYDKVFRITHYEPNEINMFQRITTSSGDILELTGEHLIHVGNDTHLALQCFQVAHSSSFFLSRKLNLPVNAAGGCRVMVVSETSL